MPYSVLGQIGRQINAPMQQQQRQQLGQSNGFAVATNPNNQQTMLETAMHEQPRMLRGRNAL